MAQLRVGVMGCANIAQRHVIPALQSLPAAFKLVAVASRTREKADAFASQFGCEALLGYRSLLERQDIDALYMPLPTGLHEEWVLKSLAAGKHLLVEKSLAMDYPSATKMIRAARKQQRVLMENFQFMYHAQQQFVRDLVGEGAIGELRSVRASFGFPPLPDDNFRYRPELGGGVLIDAAAYMVKVAQLWLGEALTVKAATLTFKDGVDLYGGAYLQDKDGLVAQVAFGMDNFYQCHYELWGSQGKITVERAYTAPPGFEPTIILEKQGAREVFKRPADNHFQNMLLEFRRTILEKDLEPKYREVDNQARLLFELKRIAHKG